MERTSKGEIGNILEKYCLLQNRFKLSFQVAQEDRQRYHNEMTLYEHGQYKPDVNKLES